MRFVGLASLVLATVLGATNASAGFIPVSDFDGVSPGNIWQTENAGGTASIAGGNLTTGDFGKLDYVMNSVNFGGFSTFKFTNVTRTGTFTSVTASVNGGTAVGGVYDLSGQTLSFAFTSPLTGVNTLSFVFSGTAGSSFTMGGLQAVPEPTTLALIGLVGAGGGVAGWRRRRAAKA